MDNETNADVPQQKNSPSETKRIAFLLPCYKTPLLASNLLHMAHDSGRYVGCAFILLLDAHDPFLLLYKELVDILTEKGMTVGYCITDGAPYCGKINRIASIVNADSVCVIDNLHIPTSNDDTPFVDKIDAWLKSHPEPMKIGIFNEEGFYIVVTKKLIERLGYMFHPLCYGRYEAEQHLLSLGDKLDIITAIEGCVVLESKNDGAEIEGFSSDEDAQWAAQTLEQTIEEETERLSDYLLN